MTDIHPTVEASIARRLEAYADIPVRAVDADAVAAAAAADRRRRIDLRVVLLAAALVGALLAGTLLAAAGAFRQPARLDLSATTPAPVPSTAASSAGPLATGLVGAWLADKPDDLSFGGPSGPARMSLGFDANGRYSFLTLSGTQQERLGASVQSDASGELRFITLAATDPVSVGGAELRGCAIGETGSYRARRSSDGLLLTLDAVSEPCPSRSAVLARTWARSLGAPSSGGVGVVDAFDPLFSVDLPAGSYSVDRAPDAMTIVQMVPEFQFLAFRDPQGFLDPCDPTAGRYDIAQGADPFVAYFRQLDGFTVDSTTELTVDGHRAVRLVVHANLDAGCPSGRRAEWQPKTATSDDPYWFLRPGAYDSLVIVELADETVMFEVLPAPHELEDQVIGSIRFLDRLPTGP